MVGQALSHFRVTGEVGRGGMGVVYRAHDIRLDRDVALKVLPAELVADPDRRRRFLQEARAAAALSDPHIAVVHEVDDEDGVTFIAMELVAGESLADQLARGRLPLATCLDLATQIAAGLAAAHAQDVVHRDLKPANILIDTQGRVKIIDFGLAKLRDAAVPQGDATVTGLDTVPGVLLGTPAYMSPEQLEGRPVDARSDVFSFGLVLYEMLGGHRAFQRDSTVAVMAAILREEPTPLADCPSPVWAIVQRCLRKAPAERYASGRDLCRALAAVSTGPSGTERRPSIAVLPFANLGGREDDEHFSEGLAEEIINALTQIPSLRVIARTSAFALGRRDVDVREVGRALDVEHVLEGSVRMAGRRVRVTAQLVTTADGSHVWSERYDRELTDVFGIQDEIARAIADKLRVGLGGTGPLVKTATANPEAYNRYLLGRHQFHKGTPEGFAAAKRLFEEAVALDPDFAVAYEALSEVWWFLGFFGLVAPREAFGTGIWAALRSLELDERSAGTHALVGMYRKELDYNWTEVHRQFARAFELDPTSPNVRFRYALTGLMPAGRLDEAIATLQGLLSTDPLSLLYRGWLAIFRGFARDYAGAVTESRGALEIEPNYPQALLTLSTGLMALGQGEEARETQQRCVDLTGSAAWALGVLGWIEGLVGRREEATRILGRLVADSARVYVPPTSVAFVHLGLGDRAAALAWLDKAVEARDPFVVPLKVWAIYDPIRKEPAYRDLLRKMNYD